MKLSHTPSRSSLDGLSLQPIKIGKNRTLEGYQKVESSVGRRPVAATLAAGAMHDRPSTRLLANSFCTEYLYGHIDEFVGS